MVLLVTIPGQHLPADPAIALDVAGGGRRRSRRRTKRREVVRLDPQQPSGTPRRRPSKSAPAGEDIRPGDPQDLIVGPKMGPGDPLEDGRVAHQLLVHLEWGRGCPVVDHPRRVVWEGPLELGGGLVGTAQGGQPVRWPRRSTSSGSARARSIASSALVRLRLLKRFPGPPFDLEQCGVACGQVEGVTRIVGVTRGPGHSRRTRACQSDAVASSLRPRSACNNPRHCRIIARFGRLGPPAPRGRGRLERVAGGGRLGGRPGRGAASSLATRARKSGRDSRRRPIGPSLQATRISPTRHDGAWRASIARPLQFLLITPIRLVRIARHPFHVPGETRPQFGEIGKRSSGSSVSRRLITSSASSRTLRASSTRSVSRRRTESRLAKSTYVAVDPESWDWRAPEPPLSGMGDPGLADGVLPCGPSQGRAGFQLSWCGRRADAHRKVFGSLPRHRLRHATACSSSRPSGPGPSAGAGS